MVTDYTIKRGRGGRPWITRDGLPLDWPEECEKPLNAELYDRISDMAGGLDTKEGLKQYQQAKAVFGVVKDKSLAWQFRALVSEHPDPWVAAKAEVKSLLTLAEKIGGDEEKSGIGSAIHRLTHLKDLGEEIMYPVAQLEPWLNAYEDAVLSRFEILADELFVVVDDLEGGEDDLRLAGNFDRLLRDRVTGDVMIGDIKSGKWDDRYAMKPTVQVAGYAHGKVYSQETGKRELIHPELNLERGVLIHLPFHGGGEPECICYPLDLEKGWRLAKMSVELTSAREMRVYKKQAITRAKG